MNDEEYIEMETRGRIPHKKKPLYALRKEDFIPIVGGFKHSKRCFEESSPLVLTSEWNLSQCFARDTVLTLYNISLIVGTGFAVSGLVELLSK